MRRLAKRIPRIAGYHLTTILFTPYYRDSETSSERRKLNYHSTSFLLLVALVCRDRKLGHNNYATPYKYTRRQIVLA